MKTEESKDSVENLKKTLISELKENIDKLDEYQKDDEQQQNAETFARVKELRTTIQKLGTDVCLYFSGLSNLTSIFWYTIGNETYKKEDGKFERLSLPHF